METTERKTLSFAQIEKLSDCELSELCENVRLSKFSTARKSATTANLVDISDITEVKGLSVQQHVVLRGHIKYAKSCLGEEKKRLSGFEAELVLVSRPTSAKDLTYSQLKELPEAELAELCENITLVKSSLEGHKAGLGSFGEAFRTLSFQ
jgi:hypothetical protein